jgi:hypothetical protein
MSNAVNFILGGIFANGLLVFLAFAGFLVLVRLKSSVSRFIVAWVFVGCASILFAAQSFVFDRFLFLLPWTVFLGLGTFWFVYSCVGQVGSRRLFWAGLLIVVIILILANSGLGYVFNINAW